MIQKYLILLGHRHHVDLMMKICVAVPRLLHGLNPDILSYVIESGSVEVFQQLSPNYSNIPTLRLNNSTVLHNAIRYGRMSFVEYFYNMDPSLMLLHGDNNTVLHVAAGVSLEMLRWVEAHMEASEFKRCLLLKSTREGRTPWFIAVVNACLDCVTYLGDTYGDLVLDQTLNNITAAGDVTFWYHGMKIWEDVLLYVLQKRPHFVHCYVKN
eukprot:PhF_6_TR44289/c0_g1_i1/m.68275